MNTIDKFLNIEITDQDMYEGIIEFIISPHVRNGEYECNIFIIKKLDYLNFIIFEEYTNRTETRREIHGATSIFVKNLIEKIQETAKVNNFNIIHENEKFYYEHYYENLG